VTTVPANDTPAARGFEPGTFRFAGHWNGETCGNSRRQVPRASPRCCARRKKGSAHGWCPGDHSCRSTTAADLSMLQAPSFNSSWRGRLTSSCAARYPTARIRLAWFPHPADHARIITSNILNRASAFTACGRPAGRLRSCPALTRCGTPPIEISDSPSTTTTSAS
jgi:hypothetical protein